MKRELRVCRLSDGEVIHTIDVSTRSENEIAKIESGLLRKVNTDLYCVDDYKEDK